MGRARHVEITRCAVRKPILMKRPSMWSVVRRSQSAARTEVALEKKIPDEQRIAATRHARSARIRLRLQVVDEDVRPAGLCAQRGTITPLGARRCRSERSPVTTVARCRLATSTTEASITSAVRVTPQSSPAARDSRRSSGSDAHLSASQEPRQRDLAASIAPCSSDYECRAELASCRATSCAK